MSGRIGKFTIGMAGAVACAALGFAPTSAQAAVAVFNDIPSSLFPDYYSFAYEATQTSELGTAVVAGNSVGGTLASATVVVSNWAPQSDGSVPGSGWQGSAWETQNPTSWNATGYFVPMTLNFYNVNPSSSLPGSLIGSVTQTQLIGWRPAATGGSASYSYYTSGSYSPHGYAEPVTFDLASSGIVVPKNFIMTVAFNTENYGANPTGTNGPYDSLNFALGGNSGGYVPAQGVATVGNYYNADQTFLKSQWQGAYNFEQGNSGTYTPPDGIGVLQSDPGWTGYQPMFSVDVVSTPVPASLGLVSVGALTLIGGLALRRRMAAKL